MPPTAFRDPHFSLERPQPRFPGSHQPLPGNSPSAGCSPIALATPRRDATLRKKAGHGILDNEEGQHGGENKNHSCLSGEGRPLPPGNGGPETKAAGGGVSEVGSLPDGIDSGLLT